MRRTLTLSTCSSSTFVKEVARRPLKMLSPLASFAPTSAPGPWQTAEVTLPAWKNCNPQGYNSRACMSRREGTHLGRNLGIHGV